MDVSIIIVNYNTCELTCQCIDSIVQKTKDVTFEIIVVDNDSTDKSKEILSADNRIIFIEANKNLGFGKANNLGYNYSKGDYILLLNSDTYLQNNAIKLFHDKMEQSNSNIACMGCLLIGADGKRTHSYANFPRIENAMRGYVAEKLLGYCGLAKWEIDPPGAMALNSNFFRVEYVTGADLFIRRCVIETLGLFDPDIFMYNEDSELQWRYSKHGYHSYIYSKPQIVHLEGKSAKGDSVYKSLMKLESHLLYLRKTQYSTGFYLLKIMLLLKSPYIIIKKRMSLEECKRFYKILM